VAPDFVEDFSSYQNVDELLAAADYLFNADRISLDSGVGYAGSDRSMRYNYPTASEAGLDNYTIGFRKDIDPEVTEIWVEAAVRFSSDFTIEGVNLAGAGALKLLHVYPRNVVGRFGINLAGGDSGHIRAEGPNDDFEDLYIYPHGGQGGPEAPITSTLFDEEWHVLRHHIRLGDDDFHEFWLDGQYLGSATGQTAGTPLYNIWLNKNMNQLADHPMELWWGKLAYWTSDPGW